MTLDDLAQIVFRATGAPLSLEEAEQIARAVVLALADDMEAGSDSIRLTVMAIENGECPKYIAPRFIEAADRLDSLVEEARAADVVQST